MRLIHRAKILTAVLQELGGCLNAIDMHRYLFLYCIEYVEHNHYYEFIPQANGPFSLQAESDKVTLVKNKLIKQTETWQMEKTSQRFATSLDFFEKIAIQKLKNEWANKDEASIQKYIAENYPEYFLENSQLQTNEDIIFYTIGYEGISPDAYISKLLASNVKLLCDVRKNAFSQKQGFSKVELQDALHKVGIEYIHIPELGIISEKRQNLDTGKDYRELFEEYENETLSKQSKNLDLLKQLLQEKQKIAITCFEASHHHCHRGRIAKALSESEGFEYRVEHL